jgi:uncharacterized protein YprB with RNaseH-like and TPR domain
VSSIDDLRKRIEALNRGPLAGRPAAQVDALRRGQRKPPQRAPSPQLLVYPRDVPLDRPRRPGPRLTDGNPIKLEEAVEGNEIATPGGGTAYLVAARVREMAGQWDGLHEAFGRLLSGQDSYLYQRLGRRGNASPLCPEQVMFVDLETTGLNYSPLFLIGTMEWEEGGLVIRQYLARNYAEEKAVIRAFVERVPGKMLLVSFNGKTFDVPYLRTRAIANAVALEMRMPHLDLLHECRRVWGGKLPDCKLQTLERHVCGRWRYGDIPGSRIPDAYHAFVRTGNASQMAVIIEHNRFDLVTLADLMVRLAESQ